MTAYAWAKFFFGCIRFGLILLFAGLCGVGFLRFLGWKFTFGFYR